MAKKAISKQIDTTPEATMTRPGSFGRMLSEPVEPTSETSVLDDPPLPEESEINAITIALHKGDHSETFFEVELRANEISDPVKTMKRLVNILMDSPKKFFFEEWALGHGFTEGTGFEVSARMFVVTEFVHWEVFYHYSLEYGSWTMTDHFITQGDSTTDPLIWEFVTAGFKALVLDRYATVR